MEVETAIRGDVETTGSSFEVPQGVEKDFSRHPDIWIIPSSGFLKLFVRYLFVEDVNNSKYNLLLISTKLKYM